MNLLFVHAHFDDYEFSAAGTFELWRQRDPQVRRRILVCTDGAAGHHAMTREATAQRRLAEQAKAAALGKFEFRPLLNSKGHPFREGCLHSAVEFLPALWSAIRDFEPDYLFCPPIPMDALAGVHVDHLDVAQAVRSVAYLINVPHAFSPEYPPDGTETEPRAIRTPVILNCYDGYLGAGNPHDLAIDITSVAERVADMAWCHESQLREWLPWVDRHNFQVAGDGATWRRHFLERLAHRKSVLGLAVPGLFEVFQVTAWGVVPTADQLLRDFPNVIPAASGIDDLRHRLDRWRAAAGQ